MPGGAYAPDQAECMHSGMNEGMLARRPGRPLAPCRPPHLPPPVFGRHCPPGPWQILAIGVSSPSAVVHAGRGRVGCAAQQACMFVRTLVCTGLACFLHARQQARMHAYIHSCMNAWRMAGRLAGLGYHCPSSEVSPMAMLTFVSLSIRFQGRRDVPGRAQR